MLRRKRRTTTSRKATQIESVEQRLLLSAASVDEIAAIDGTGNNLENEEWGAAHVDLERWVAVEYEDGFSTLAGEDRPSAREVSNVVVASTGDEHNSRYLTDITWIWGQFIDHDLDLSEGSSDGEAANIAVPAGDAWFDPFGTGTAEISLTRTPYEFDADGVAQQANAITAFLDGSVVYGSDDERAAALRTFERGLLKTSDGDLLPWNTEGLDNAGGSGANLFAAGDVRANENIALTSMHTIWVREHNRIATELAEDNPKLSDEDLYQQARAQVRAQLQAITYNEFLPALFGHDAVSEYDGYDSGVNPNIANAFSTAAYRFGHTMLSSELLRLDADGNVVEEGNIALQSAFFRPDELVATGIDSVLRGATVNVAQEIDNQIVDDVRNFLFGPPGAGGFDLASLNIQRGRDHGLADYNQARVDMGLEPVNRFSDITSDATLAANLETLYGDVDNIDLWVGGLAEDHEPGSSMGETFSSIIVAQFEAIRDGDRFWYQNIMDGRELKEIENTTLADVIQRNTDIEGLQENIFFAPSVLHVDASDTRSDEITIRERDGEVQVVDSRGRVLGSMSAEDTERVMIIGDQNGSQEFTVTAIDAETLPGGIVIEHGSGRRDEVQVVGSSQADTITVDDTQIVLNDLTIENFGTDQVVVRAGRGGDTVTVAEDAEIDVRIFGEQGADRLIGGRGNDFIDGGNGNDRIDGRTGHDQLFGRNGNDRLFGRGGRDLLDGGDGNDRLRAGGGNDSLIGGKGVDRMQGGAGTNRFELRGPGADLIEQFTTEEVRAELPCGVRDAVFTRDELERLFA